VEHRANERSVKIKKMLKIKQTWAVFYSEREREREVGRRQDVCILVVFLLLSIFTLGYVIPFGTRISFLVVERIL